MSDVYKTALRVIEDNAYGGGGLDCYSTDRPSEILYALGYIEGIIDMANELAKGAEDE